MPPLQLSTPHTPIHTTHTHTQLTTHILQTIHKLKTHTTLRPTRCSVHQFDSAHNPPYTHEMHIINCKIRNCYNATNAYVQIKRPSQQTTKLQPTLRTCANNPVPRSQNGATDTQIDLSAINKQLEETIRVARQVKEAEAAAAAVAQSAASSPVAQAPIPLKSTGPIQLSFNNELPAVNAASSGAGDVKTLASNDLQLSESKSPAIDELTLDSAEDTADLDDRNKSNLFKRFLSFGGAGLAGGSSGGAGAASPSGNSLGGGAGGGSGNFLLDVVRVSIACVIPRALHNLLSSHCSRPRSSSPAACRPSRAMRPPTV
ncbi:hypothetical protein KR222_011208 [Zaprionus bogoriensis]|nr:hypothetical protein KR222_011208 [Zaprionus bogoriensis]